MTATLTLSCPEGMVLATDRRITSVDQYGNVLAFEDNVDKIFKFAELPIGISYWGLAGFGSNTMLQTLIEFEKQVKSSDDINIISEKLKKYFESFTPAIETSMGLHVAGYCCGKEGSYPQIRHVFHISRRQKPGEFTNENSNQEYHSFKGKRIPYYYDPFVALFNGDNAIANALFNFLPDIYPSRRRQIILDLLSLDECIRFAKLVIETSGDVLDFLFTLDQKKAIPAVHGLMIAKITEKNGFEWVNP